jgi:starvation-inducible DNA-binding protein
VLAAPCNGRRLRLSSTEVSRTYIVRAPADNEKTAATIRSVLKIAQDAGDEPPAGLLTDRLQVLEKQLWMMKSMSK